MVRAEGVGERWGVFLDFKKRDLCVLGEMWCFILFGGIIFYPTLLRFSFFFFFLSTSISQRVCVPLPPTSTAN